MSTHSFSALKMVLLGLTVILPCSCKIKILHEVLNLYLQSFESISEIDPAALVVLTSHDFVELVLQLEDRGFLSHIQCLFALRIWQTAHWWHRLSLLNEIRDSLCSVHLIVRIILGPASTVTYDQLIVFNRSWTKLRLDPICRRYFAAKLPGIRILTFIFLRSILSFRNYC